MLYAHDHYIRYLLSKRLVEDDIRAKCMSMGLLVPDDNHLRRILVSMPNPPSAWAPTFSAKNVALRRWLKKLGVEAMWRYGAEAREAIRFLAKSSPREDFQALRLLGMGVDDCHVELVAKYGDKTVPSVASLELFCDYFWSFDGFEPSEVQEFLSLLVERDHYLPAMQGDIAASYARLGLKQRVETEELYLEVMAAGLAAARRLRKSMDTVGGAAAGGLSSVIAAGLKAAEMYEDHRKATQGAKSLRQEGMDFVLQVRHDTGMLHLDDLQRLDVIDAEIDEGVDEEVPNGLRLLP